MSIGAAAICLNCVCIPPLSCSQVVSIGAAAIWGLATTSACRRSLADLDAVHAVVAAIKRSLKLVPVPDPEPSASSVGGKPTGGAELSEESLGLPEGGATETQRATLQKHLLGALAMLLVDRSCRRPYILLEPSFATLFELCKDLEGYRPEDAASRRETAAKVGAVTHIFPNTFKFQTHKNTYTQIRTPSCSTDPLAVLSRAAPPHFPSHTRC